MTASRWLCASVQVAKTKLWSTLTTKSNSIATPLLSIASSDPPHTRRTSLPQSGNACSPTPSRVTTAASLCTGRRVLARPLQWWAIIAAWCSVLSLSYSPALTVWPIPNVSSLVPTTNSTTSRSSTCLINHESARTWISGRMSEKECSSKTWSRSLPWMPTNYWNAWWQAWRTGILVRHRWTGNHHGLTLSSPFR